mmetsp:Transcript_42704/g.117870  ORF Transcript_42704/g.117870 Transcript_42704/m.117870 type:complete len:909 (+) Transcript_42704:98-2824(+)
MPALSARGMSGVFSQRPARGVQKPQDLHRHASELSSPSSGSAPRTEALEREATASHSNPFETLVNIMIGRGALELFRPLGEAIAFLGGGANLLQKDEQKPAIIALEQAAKELAISTDPRRHLEYALFAHCEEAKTRMVLGSIEGALAILLHTTASTEVTGPVHAALRAWQHGSEKFLQSCSEVWELHHLCVFLDVKGDQALLEQTARHLCTALRCTPAGLSSCLIRTRPWVEKALRVFAEAKEREVLERRLRAALTEWHEAWISSWEEKRSKLESFVGVVDGANNIWEVCFANVQHISWPDFWEAFSESFMQGQCPIDIKNQLRSKVDPTSTFRVRRSVVADVLREYSGVPGLVQSLVAEVQQDLGAHIYREEPLCNCELPLPTEQLALAAGRFLKMAFGEAQIAAPSASPVADSCGTDTPVGPAQGHQAPGVASRPTAKATQRFTAVSDVHANAVTPQELAEGLRSRPNREVNTALPWDDYCARLWVQNRPFWANLEDTPTPTRMHEEATLRVAALRTVVSDVVNTNLAVVLRIATGSLGENRPPIQLNQSPCDEQCGAFRATDLAILPGLVTCANTSRFKGATRFGRCTARSFSQADHALGEPIASRSHFSIVYDQNKDDYCLMDTGSKWGTFVRVVKRHKLCCGDSIRAGNVEFVIRYCGGGCNSHRRHAHFKLNALRSIAESTGGSQSSYMRPSEELEDEQREEEELADPMRLLNGGRHRYGWDSTAVRLSRRHAMNVAGHLGGTEPATSASSTCQAAALPVSPMEIEFLAGSRIGEKTIISNRISTLGRSDDATVQVGDMSLTNVSRIHCAFEYKGGRWEIRDTGSTNGTWRRLSCILEPSTPVPLQEGDQISAGTHEFVVQKAEMSCWCAPSVGIAALQNLIREKNRNRQQEKALKTGSTQI